MSSTPETSKYLSVAADIERDVRSGLWEGGRMPSVRKVADTHHVSVVTASRALQVLRDKGLIRTVERSGCYRIPPAQAERWAIVLRVTPGPMAGLTAAVTRGGFEQLSRIEPMHLHFDAFEISGGLTKDDAAKAAATAKANGIGGVFLLPTRCGEGQAAADIAFLEGCAAARLPVVLIERNVCGKTDLNGCDLVALDDTGGATAAVQHLLDIGRKSIGVVVASPVSSHWDRVAGYLFAQHRAASKKRNFAAPHVIHQPMDRPTNEAYAAVADEVVRHKLDGVVCYSDYTALGLVMELLRRGKRVPKDVAVVGFDNLPIGEQFAIQLTTYDYPAAIMARHAVRLMRDRIADPDRPPVKLVVPGRLIIRGSTVEGAH
jgi:LacI family transcriptional regulator